MTTHQLHDEEDVTYFVTFTCYDWLPLFKITHTYEQIYKWFDVLTSKQAKVIGYVLMPNHVHVLIHIRRQGPVLNKLVANGKRFLAYAIVKKLISLGHEEMLDKLAEGVQSNERAKGKKHQVFRLSFDAKLCWNEHIIVQKLDYMHANPVTGRWKLVKEFMEYKHSSASFYETGNRLYDNIVHYKDI